MGAVAALQRHIRAHIEVLVNHPQVDLGDVRHIIWGYSSPGVSAHIPIDRGQIADRIGPQMNIVLLIFLLCWVNTFLIINKAVHKLSGGGKTQPQVVGTKIKGIENSLDPVGVKAVAILHL